MNASLKSFSLEQVRIQSPCTEDWSRMAGGNEKRFCDKCQLHVHNLSAMPSEEAAQLLAHRTGRLCIRYEIPAPVPSATPAGHHKARWPAWSRRAAAMLGLSTIALWGAAGCDERANGSPSSPTAATQPGCPTRIMGEMAASGQRLIEILGRRARPAPREVKGEAPLVEIPTPPLPPAAPQIIQGKIACPPTPADPPATQPAG